VAKDIRKVTVKNFYIFYSVDEQLKIVNILHILYKGMDISKICD
jgi:plasmid stabilization system protein ParE